MTTTLTTPTGNARIIYKFNATNVTVSDPAATLPADTDYIIPLDGTLNYVLDLSSITANVSISTTVLNGSIDPIPLSKSVGIQSAYVDKKNQLNIGIQNIGGEEVILEIYSL